MPLLITGILLARKLSLKGDWSKSAGGPPQRLGPFALAAGGKAGSGTTIVVDGAQIIGFFCEPVPRCPTPSPNLFK
jgi:hypothetical protein